MTDVVPFERPTRDRHPGLVDTPTARTVEHILEQCRLEGAIGAVRGGVGIGKTETARRFAARHEGVVITTVIPKAKGMDYIKSNLLSALDDIREGNGYGRYGYYGAISSLSNELLDALKQVELLIIDEANHADGDLLERWRLIHDAAAGSDWPFGLVLLGNPALFHRSRKHDPWQYGPLFDRCSYWHEVDRPTDDDVAAALDAWQLRAARSRQLLCGIATSGHGLRKIVQVVERAIALGGACPPGLAALEHAAAQCLPRVPTWR